VLFALNACTVKHRVIPTGEIPKIHALNPGEEEFGKSLFEDLCEDNQLDSQNVHNEQLAKVFDNLIQAAQADHLPWQIHLFKDPELADVRAVHGNFIFVWSGFLDIVEELLRQLPQRAKPHSPDNLSTGQYNPVSPALQIHSTSESAHPSEEGS
jgi:hypothetical protein